MRSLGMPEEVGRQVGSGGCRRYARVVMLGAGWVPHISRSSCYAVEAPFR